MDRRTILWHCPPRHLGRAVSSPSGPQALQNASEEPGARSGKQEEGKPLLRLDRPWRLTSDSKGGFPVASPRVSFLAQSQHTSWSIQGEPGCPRNMAGALAGDAGPQSSTRSWDFSRLLQINRVFAGTVLSHRSQAMSGLLNIYLQMWVTVTVNGVSLSRGMRHLCLNMYLCYFQAAQTSCWCDCWLWHCML